MHIHPHNYEKVIFENLISIYYKLWFTLDGSEKLWLIKKPVKAVVTSITARLFTES
jgi:hypothetical protein